MITPTRPRNPLRAISRIAGVGLAVLTTFALVVGCSNNEDAPPKNTAPLPEAKVLVDGAATSARTLRDVFIDLYVDGTVPKLPVKSVSAYLTNDPQVGGQGDADVVFQGSAVKAKFVVTGGDLWAQLGPGQSYQNLGKASNVYDASAILGPNKGVANLIGSVRDPKTEDREQIGDINTVRLSGIITASALAGIVPNAQDVGDRPVTLWIQEDAPHNLVRANVGFDTGALSVTLSGWGEKQKLIDPKTAK